MDLGQGEDGINWESSIDTHPLPCLKHIAGGELLPSTGSAAWRSVMTCRGGMGQGGRLSSGDTCMHTGDSLCGAGETNATMCIDYTTIKRKKEG